MDYYFFIKLRRKVPTRKHKLGMDTAVGDARLLPEPERYTEGRGHLAIKGKD